MAVVLVVIGLLVLLKVVAPHWVAASAFTAVVGAVKPPDSRVLAVDGKDLPGGMAPGTCIEYNPTGPDRHHTVFIDPGSPW